MRHCRLFLYSVHVDVRMTLFELNDKVKIHREFTHSQGENASCQLCQQRNLASFTFRIIMPFIKKLYVLYIFCVWVDVRLLPLLLRKLQTSRTLSWLPQSLLAAHSKILSPLLHVTVYRYVTVCLFVCLFVWLVGWLVGLLVGLELGLVHLVTFLDQVNFPQFLRIAHKMVIASALLTWESRLGRFGKSLLATCIWDTWIHWERQNYFEILDRIRQTRSHRQKNHVGPFVPPVMFVTAVLGWCSELWTQII